MTMTPGFNKLLVSFIIIHLTGHGLGGQMHFRGNP